jgi:hypothetical protein
MNFTGSESIVSAIKKPRGRAGPSWGGTGQK